jgi:hypothetical protein
MENRFEQGMTEPVQDAQEERKNYSKEKILAMALAVAMSVSACVEKAKQWSGEQLQQFSKEHPNAERLEKTKMDQMVKTFREFQEYVKEHNVKTVDLIDSKRRAKYPESMYGAYTDDYQATMLEDGSILVEDDSPVIQQLRKERKVGDSFYYISDYIYQVVKKENGEELFVAKEGIFLTGGENDRPQRETGVDVNTGLVTYFDNPDNAAYGATYELVDHDGKLEMEQNSTYKILEPGQGQKSAETAANHFVDIQRYINERQKK